MHMDLGNGIGWIFTLLFIGGLYLYIRYRAKKEEDE